MGLRQAGHAVLCFGDAAIAQEFASAHIPVEAVPSEIAFGGLHAAVAQWTVRRAGTISALGGRLSADGSRARARFRASTPA
jgi:hypothetical protein